jgi:hypothetical protein
VSSFGTNPAKLGALINSPSFMVSLTPNLGTIKSNVDTLANPSQLAHQRIVAARAHRGVRIATAHLAVTHRGKTLLTFSYTKAGHKLVTKLAKQNRARIRHHKRPLTLKLRLTDVFTPKHGKARTLTRVFTIKPGVPKPKRHK